MTKGELRRRMSHAEFDEWQAYYTIEPWGTEPADRRAALICSTMANIHRPKRSPAIGLNKFLPNYGKTKKRQSWQEQARIARMWSKG